MNYKIKINIEPSICIKLLKIINNFESTTPSKRTTFLNLKNKLKISSEKLENQLLFLEKELYIEKRVYVAQNKDFEYVGFVNYATKNKGINFFKEKNQKFPSKYKLKFKINTTTAKNILKVIKSQNKKGVYPKKNSALITIHQTIKNTDCSDFGNFCNYLLFLLKRKKIKTKRYTGPSIGYEDIITL